MPEYHEIVRLERTPDMFQHVTIGNDVWIGRNVNVLPGVCRRRIRRDEDVPPYAIVAGAPAQVRRMRLSDAPLIHDPNKGPRKSSAGSLT